MKIAFRGALGLTLALLMTGCVTGPTFRGPSSYVDYPYNGKVKSSTLSATVGTKPKLQSTYEDEFIYDAQGNLIKHKQTEYFNYDSKEPAYVVWETEFKLVGGVLLPYRQRANDVVYVEIDYDTLVSQAKGPIVQGTLNRRFSVQYDKYYVSWYPQLKKYPVAFRSDDKFVVTQTTMDYYRGLQDENVLTLGYDNVVLKHYLYSHSKLREGVNKSFQYGQFAAQESNIRTDDSEFTYEWAAIANSIVQTKGVFTQSSGPNKMVFEAKAEYNDAGQRTKETWTAQQGKKDPIVLFEQTLKY